VPVVYSGVTNTGYRGYWARDFKKTEEHFGTLAEIDALISGARQSNPAIASGTHKQRCISNDVYVYEGHFGADVVLVSMNKVTKNQLLADVNTALPACNYADYQHDGSPVCLPDLASG